LNPFTSTQPASEQTATGGQPAPPTPAAPGAVLELHDAAVRVGGSILWSGVDLTVGRGEFVAVLGPNGAGKSTLLKVLLGLLPTAAGQVLVLGQPPGRASHKIGYLPQRRSFDASVRIRGTDVVRRSGGVIVGVRGRAPRAVPVLARYHAPLLQAAAFTGQDFLTGGTEPERGNITNPLTRSLAGGGGLPPLDTSRLRATWLAETAALIGLPEFMHAAGISCCQRLGDITAGLDPGTEEHAVALLGGQAR